MMRLLLAIAAACFLTKAAAAQEPPPTPVAVPEDVRAYAQLPFLSDALLSPDGRRIAARVAAEGDEWIDIWTIADGPDQQPAMIPAAAFQSFRWLGDGKLLINRLTVGVRAARDRIYLGPSRRVFVHDLATRETRALGTGEGLLDEVIHVDPDARSLLLSSQEDIAASPSVY